MIGPREWQEVGGDFEVERFFERRVDEAKFWSLGALVSFALTLAVVAWLAVSGTDLALAASLGAAFVSLSIQMQANRFWTNSILLPMLHRVRLIEGNVEQTGYSVETIERRTRSQF
jgi:membrane protein implicated in regulation of membrane protease activity